jgi:hypothetical protein
MVAFSIDLNDTVSAWRAASGQGTGVKNLQALYALSKISRIQIKVRVTSRRMLIGYTYIAQN